MHFFCCICSIFFFFFFFFFNDTATTEIYTLSLHDALPIFISFNVVAIIFSDKSSEFLNFLEDSLVLVRDRKSTRLNSSHQIISYAVFCLKKKKKKRKNNIIKH